MRYHLLLVSDGVMIVMIVLLLMWRYDTVSFKVLNMLKLVYCSTRSMCLMRLDPVLSERQRCCGREHLF